MIKSKKTPKTHTVTNGTGGSSRSYPVIIVTGLSGAGKSQALKVLEDFGYFCVDNLPTTLVPKFLDMLENPAAGPLLEKVALGIDIRAKSFLEELPQALEEFKARRFSCRILFLDSSEEVLLRRFSETRHRHPLGGKALLDAIRTEKARMMTLRERADKVIDTSALTLGELKETVSAFLGVVHEREMNLAVVSFGYKYGLPIDADIIWDVRFLPNPNYIASLKPLTGLQPQVSKYVLGNIKAKGFVSQLVSALRKLLPSYIQEGKSYLTIGIGCTGGHHRSVAIAHELSRMMRGAGYAVREFHRDIDKGA